MSDAPAPAAETRSGLVLTRIVMAAVIGAMLFGIGASIYMSLHHELTVYGDASVQFELVGCAESEGVSCDVVNTSEWSEVFGVPTFTWAIPTYIALIALAGWAAWGNRKALWLLAAGGVGISAFSAFLYYISVVEIGSVCLWCMRLYAVNGGVLLGAILALLPVLGARLPSMPGIKDLGVGAGVFAVATVLCVGAQQAYRSTLLGDAPDTQALSTEAVVEIPDDPLAFVDPDGELEPRTITVTTEDGNEKELRIRATDAWKGNPDAEVVLVEFADLECGFCKRAATELKQLYRAYGDRVLFVFKHYPVNRTCNPGMKSLKHRNACNASMAAICAQDQGKFWAYHDLAFKNQHALGREALTDYAAALDLDMDAWQRCVTSASTRDRLTANGEDGAAIEAHGTPRIFINGTLYKGGSSARQLAKDLERALGVSREEATRRMAALGTTRAAPIAPIPADVPAMTEVHHGDLHFAIDTFEASLSDAGQATSGKREIPALRMSWFAANDACEAAGKRMCTEREWLAACQGAEPVDDDNDGAFADDRIEGTAYPYGDLHEPPRCWSSRHPDNERPVYTGEMPGCVGPDGVYDMVGNAEEWVGATPDEAVLLGGAYDTRSDKARCYRRNDTFGAGYANKRTGFRCCQTLDAPTDSDVP